MPAIDNCEEAVIHALEKEGWEVLDRPYTLRLGTIALFADLNLINSNNNEIIVVEVKCFPNNKSYFDDFYRSIKQYLLYRKILSSLEIESNLYLAVPNKIYEDFLQLEVIDALILEDGIKLVIVDLEREEIKKWQN